MNQELKMLKVKKDEWIAVERYFMDQSTFQMYFYWKIIAEKLSKQELSIKKIEYDPRYLSWVNKLLLD